MGRGELRERERDSEREKGMRERERREGGSERERLLWPCDMHCEKVPDK